MNRKDGLDRQAESSKGYTIDVAFDVYSDTPKGRDPDSHSPMLRNYHRLLWSKKLPDGTFFELTDRRPKSYLHHLSERGEFHLSSDSFGHTYRFVKSMRGIVDQIPVNEMDAFFRVCSTIGAYIVFPARRINGKATINGARGLSARIKDRFDLTLECIRLHYDGQDSPLRDALQRYADFFDLFGNFRDYVEFFLLQDFVKDDGRAVNFFLPFSGFERPALPTDVNAYCSYRDNIVRCISARNQRILAYWQ